MYNFNVQITIMHKLFVITCREALINLPMNLMHVFTFLEVFSRTKLLKTSIQNGLTVFKINQLILNTFVVFLFIQSSRLYHWPTNPVFQIRMTMKTADWNQNIIEMRVIPNYKAHFWTKQSRKSVFQDGTFRINVELVLFISCVNLKIDW